jgi:CRISPR-associated endonuclease/helicase Cas3
MAQRFGRVNRFGQRTDTRLDVVYPEKFDEKDKLTEARRLTLDLLKDLGDDASPAALASLDRERRLAAFTPTPIIPPTSDILFDSWALTSIRGKMPGRPSVEPYLHGISEWEPPETYVAWREEVDVINDTLREIYDPEELLEAYPLKPHELLRDTSSRVFDCLKEIQERMKAESSCDTPIWILSDDGSVDPTSLVKVIAKGKEILEYKTILLPPSAGGLDQDGLLSGKSAVTADVSEEWFEGADQTVPRRCRIRSDDPRPASLQGMRLVLDIDTKAASDDDESEIDESTPVEQQEASQGRYWRWYVRPRTADDDLSKTAVVPIPWKDHTCQVTEYAKRIAVNLGLSLELQKAIELAAKFHDLGKRRLLWQRSIGNPNPSQWYAKSGRDPQTGIIWKPLEITTYRHEFGSLVDVNAESEFQTLSDDMKDLVLHLLAAHHGYGRPHFPSDRAFDPEPKGQDVSAIAAEVPRRFARLQRRYGRWGLAYLESLLRAADYAASAAPAREGNAK